MGQYVAARKWTVKLRNDQPEFMKFAEETFMRMYLALEEFGFVHIDIDECHALLAARESEAE